jgi:DNA-binding transcriptional MerR regulator
MFSIGDFATLGRVSVRMLRHYDAIGLLRPARVDDHTGYRFYEAEQLKRLNRLVALKDLGFTLAQVAEIVNAKVDTGELRGMLRLRQAELAQRISADAGRLSRIEARLLMIEREGAMSTRNVTVKQVAPVTVTTVSGVTESRQPEDIGPVVRSLFEELSGNMERDQVRPNGTAIATYAPADGDRLRVMVACPVGDNGQILDGIEQAACYVHHGTMDTIGEGYQILATWIEDNGYRTDGTAREVYLVSHPEPQERWQTELQMPVTQH